MNAVYRRFRCWVGIHGPESFLLTERLLHSFGEDGSEMTIPVNYLDFTCLECGQKTHTIVSRKEYAYHVSILQHD